MAQQLAFVHKQVQERKLQISDVGKSITLLGTHLQDDYPLSYKMPEELPIANAFGSHILHQFWGKDCSTGIIYFKSKLIYFRNQSIGNGITTTSISRRNF